MDEKLELVFKLVILYQLKHYASDFLLQNKYMLTKNRPTWDFVKPLSLHCGIHALGTFFINWICAPHMLWLCFFDFATHFLVDRMKSGPRYLGRFNDPCQTYFWYAFGLDQTLHHLTYICMIYWTL